jgi:hypothetical protein
MTTCTSTGNCRLYWLVVCVFFVLNLVVVGGGQRTDSLTHSLTLKLLLLFLCFFFLSLYWNDYVVPPIF